MPDYTCRACGENNPVQFYNTRTTAPTLCKKCKRTREQIRVWGITYEELIQQFGDTCNICQMPEKIIDHRTGEIHRLSVDHDHKCCTSGCRSCIRGLLCRRCNYKLGQFEEEIEWIQWAQKYLRGD